MVNLLPSSTFLAGKHTPAPDTYSFEECVISSAVSNLKLNSVALQSVTSNNDNMHKLLELMECDIPEFHHKLSAPLHRFHQFWDDLPAIDGVVLYRDHLAIPPSSSRKY